MKHVLLNNLESKHILVMTLVSLCNIAKEKCGKYENCVPETSTKLFVMLKKSSVKRNLRRCVCRFRQNVNSFAITYLM